MDKKVKSIKIITIISVVIMFACIIILTCQLIKIGTLKEKNKDLSTYKEALLEEIYNYNSTNSYYGNNRQEFLKNCSNNFFGFWIYLIFNISNTIIKLFFFIILILNLFVFIKVVLPKYKESFN